MLSSVKISSPEIRVREEVTDEGVTFQQLVFRVGGVFSLDGEYATGIWVNYHDGEKFHGPVLMDYDSWKKVNRLIKTQWRHRKWRKFTFFDRIRYHLSRLDIRLL